MGQARELSPAEILWSHTQHQNMQTNRCGHYLGGGGGAGGWWSALVRTLINHVTIFLLKIVKYQYYHKNTNIYLGLMF